MPSVVGGLVDCPVIAVPTSIGYGASFGGPGRAAGDAQQLRLERGGGQHRRRLQRRPRRRPDRPAGRAGPRSVGGRGDPGPVPAAEGPLMTIERVDDVPTLPETAGRQPQGDLRHRPGRRRRAGMAGAAALVGASALRSGAGLVRVASPGRGPADRRQLRAVLHDLSRSIRRRWPDPLRAGPPGDRPAARAGRRPGHRARAGPVGRAPRAGPLGRRVGQGPDGPRRRRAERPGRADRPGSGSAPGGPHAPSRRVRPADRPSDRRDPGRPRGPRR